MRKVLFYTTVACGAVAAYLLFRRGVPVSQIAADVMQHPIGTLVHELQSASAS